MKFSSVPNHPECRRWFLGVNGPVEPRLKVIITMDHGKWSWRYKRPGERDYIYLGPVQRLKTIPRMCEEIRLVELVAKIY